MGPGVPNGTGAKFGCPDRPVIVFAGDRAIQMSGLAERDGGLAEVRRVPDAGRRPPTAIGVHTDPNVPPHPPHATFEQTKDAAQSIVKGDENAWWS